MYIAFFTTGGAIPLANPVPALLKQTEASLGVDALKPAPVSADVTLPLEQQCAMHYIIFATAFSPFLYSSFVFRVSLGLDAFVELAAAGSRRRSHA